MKSAKLTSLIMIFAATQVIAERGFAETTGEQVCEYRPSELIGGTGAGVLATGSAAVSGTGAAGVAAGFYTLKHAVTGATMLGSTAGGASGAGTVGIMGGTGGLIGGAASILMAPATIVGAALVAVSTAGFEGYCYYMVDDVITDPEVIEPIIVNIAANADPYYFRYVTNIGEKRILIAEKIDENGINKKWGIYYLENLYIQNGKLKHKDLMRDTLIGDIGFITAATTKDK